MWHRTARTDENISTPFSPYFSTHILHTNPLIVTLPVPCEPPDGSWLGIWVGGRPSVTPSRTGVGIFNLPALWFLLITQAASAVPPWRYVSKLFQVAVTVTVNVLSIYNHYFWGSSCDPMRPGPEPTWAYRRAAPGSPSPYFCLRLHLIMSQ